MQQHDWSSIFRSSHITPLLRSLHWLSVAARIRFKTLMLAYKAKNGPAPSYMRSMVKARSIHRVLQTSRTRQQVFLVSLAFRVLTSKSYRAYLDKNVQPPRSEASSPEWAHLLAVQMAVLDQQRQEIGEVRSMVQTLGQHILHMSGGTYDALVSSSYLARLTLSPKFALAVCAQSTDAVDEKPDPAVDTVLLSEVLPKQGSTPPGYFNRKS
ncbi:hypothetical protein P4O66_010142 [Electrophorus voltai]|uniref:Uncharacterized protein n=1 Tax=Electrophorus voltai TaxID=2609070 RepID=A0AAD9DTP5_9TELE|nr:hypothetical protein P4O66_010142 [Electrophorus voltai]